MGRLHRAHMDQLDTQLKVDHLQMEEDTLDHLITLSNSKLHSTHLLLRTLTMTAQEVAEVATTTCHLHLGSRSWLA